MAKVQKKVEYLRSKYRLGNAIGIKNRSVEKLDEIYPVATIADFGLGRFTVVNIPGNAKHIRKVACEVCCNKEKHKQF